MPIIRPGDPIWIKGKAHLPTQLRYLDEAGHELHHVTWIDTDRHTFAQHVLDEDGKPQIDPDDPIKAWEIVRHGRVRMEPR